MQTSLLRCLCTLLSLHFIVYAPIYITIIIIASEIILPELSTQTPGWITISVNSRDHLAIIYARCCFWSRKPDRSIDYREQTKRSVSTTKINRMEGVGELRGEWYESGRVWEVRCCEARIIDEVVLLLFYNSVKSSRLVHSKVKRSQHSINSCWEDRESVIWTV